MDRVQVLLSSYNGKSYIREQVQSILTQKGVDVSCLIRDDGSDEENRAYLQCLQQDKVRMIYGKNVGWKRSFYQLVFAADDFPFYAFADQDDVWYEWKLEHAINKLKDLPQDVPCLYYSNVDVTDENLHIIGEKINIAPPEKKESSLNICYGQGCTMVFNRAARDLFMKYPIEEPISHECWMAILVIYFGNIIYDKEKTLLYRQHQNNSLGATPQSKLKLIFNMLRCKKDLYYPYYRYLYKGYSDMLEDKEKAILEDFMNCRMDFKAKLRLIKNKHIRRYTRGGTISLKWAILLGKI